jgi:thiamine-phosphate pyrophosphorylase
MQLAPQLIVFTDTTLVAPEAMLARFAALAEAAREGAVLFTLRDYHLSMRARLDLGLRLRALAVQTGQSFGVADRADLARALGARALHLPENGLSAHDARDYLGPDALVSRACHDPLVVSKLGVDAVLLSPIFDVRKGRTALGLGPLQRAHAACAAATTAPALYALGGVDAGNAAACLAAGATGVAVIGAALAADPAPLLEALEISRP